MVRPAAWREAAFHLVTEDRVSERRACDALDMHRSTKRYEARPRDDRDLRLRLKRLAADRPRYGCPRLYELLRRDNILVNHKKAHRLYREEGLQVRRKTRRKRLSALRAPLEAATKPNRRWSVDFVSDQLADGHRLRILTLVDDFSRKRPNRESQLRVKVSAGFWTVRPAAPAATLLRTLARSDRRERSRKSARKTNAT